MIRVKSFNRGEGIKDTLLRTNDENQDKDELGVMLEKVKENKKLFVNTVNTSKVIEYLQKPFAAVCKKNEDGEEFEFEGFPPELSAKIVGYTDGDFGKHLLGRKM